MVYGCFSMLITIDWVCELTTCRGEKMIYASEQRANEVAAMLNERKGHAPSVALLTRFGWTVVCGWTAEQRKVTGWEVRV